MCAYFHTQTFQVGIRTGRSRSALVSVYCQTPAPALMPLELSPTIPKSRSSLSARLNPRGFKVRNLNTCSHAPFLHASFSSACVPHTCLRSPELRHDTWVLVAGLSPLCFSPRIVVLVLFGQWVCTPPSLGLYLSP